MTILAGPTAVDPTPPGRGRRRWMLPAAVAGWAVVLLLLAYVSVGRDAPTTREQRDINQALPLLQAAMGQLLTAVGPGAVVDLQPVRVSTGCRISVVRDGATGRADLTVYPAAGAAPALLERVAAALPAAYRAVVYRGGSSGSATLDAEPGEFVGVRGRISDDGVVTLTAATGCRPMPAGFDLDAGPRAPVPLHPEQVRVLGALGVAGPGRADPVPAVPCPGGRSAQPHHVTVPRGPADPGGALRPVLAGATVLRAGPQRYAYLSAGTSVVVEVAAENVRIAATAGCPA